MALQTTLHTISPRNFAILLEMAKTKIYYFAYGSNLSPKQMLKRCPHAKFIAKAKILNHTLVFTGYSSRWRGGVATIINKQNSSVWGVIYELDPDCLSRLDGFEGLKYKRYKRKRVVCHFANGKKKLASVYIKEPRKITHSGRRYFSTIIAGAEHFELPANYIKTLRASR